METGKTVILLGLENLYECLYDLLNQYYEYFRGQRYVNIGFGTNRVKCPVHRNFRYLLNDFNVMYLVKTEHASYLELLTRNN